MGGAWFWFNCSSRLQITAGPASREEVFDPGSQVRFTPVLLRDSDASFSPMQEESQDHSV